MKRIAILLPALALLSACSEAPPPHVLRTGGTHDCAQVSRVTVEASSVAISFIGACQRIVIKGDGNTLAIASVSRIEIAGKSNTVAVDAVDRIHISGSNNAVRYRKNLTRVTAFTTYGNNNDIAQAR